METITNAASTVTSTVSSLIYGQPAKENETGGKEPLSGEQGKGTVSEPFDQGNSENPVNTASSTNTAALTSSDPSNKDDEFLKLNPTMGQSTTGDSSTRTKTGTTGHTSIPIVPLNPDVATSSSGQGNTTASTGIADKAGVSDKVWKPTDIDEVKPSGAPGAGPDAPDYKVATPDLSSTTSNKLTEHSDSVIAAKDSDAPKKQPGVEMSHSDSAHVQPSVGGPIEEILNKGISSKDEHTVPESEANDPHSKMNDKTTRSTEPHKTDVGKVESHPAESSGRASESSKPSEPASPTAGDEKSEKKMSQLKDKLKNKLHIGSKDK